MLLFFIIITFYLLSQLYEGNDMYYLPLYSSLPQAMQAQVFQPSLSTKRKVVFATNIGLFIIIFLIFKHNYYILYYYYYYYYYYCYLLLLPITPPILKAETSITIEGIKYVVDSGLVKINYFNVHSGVDTLVCRTISKASVELI